MLLAQQIVPLPAGPADRQETAKRESSHLTPGDGPNLLAQNLGPQAPPLTIAAAAAASTNPVDQTAGIAVSVGYADNSDPSLDFPTPWQGSPNTIYLGGGSSIDAGAVRLDNTTGAPISVDSVMVDLQRPGPEFELWGSFVIPAQGSAILTQTVLGDFDTSSHPIVGCGLPLDPSETRIPKITVTIAGTPNEFLDTAHVLDTGGFDLGCRGNKSLQWRPIGTTGIDDPAGSILLTPDSSNLSGGIPFSATAEVKDANNQPLANATVRFQVISGPNAGRAGLASTDSNGFAGFTYSSQAQGADIVQAFLPNGSGAEAESNQITATWTSLGCTSPSPPPSPGATELVYLGALAAKFGEPLRLGALLTDGAGNPLAGQTIVFTVGGQTVSATTDANGVARTTITLQGFPGLTPLTASFAGNPDYDPSQVSASVNISRQVTSIRYTGKTLLGTLVPQDVTALLLDGLGQPLENKVVTFEVGTVQVSATTDANGVAATQIVLPQEESSGPSTMKVSFAGDAFYEPSFQSTPINVHLSTSFVVWGGNVEGLKLGDTVNFWGSQWTNQVIEGEFVNSDDFKGHADPITVVQVCQPLVQSGALTSDCWKSKPGQSFPPPLEVPAFIQVIVTNLVVKQQGLIFGNIAAVVVVQVDENPPYAPNPGSPGFGTIVSVIDDGAGIFPERTEIDASQTQPVTVLPGENFDVNLDVTNPTTTTATTVVANESFDDVSPTSATFDFGSVVASETKSTSFQVTAPTIAAKGAGESSEDYLARLGSENGRKFTSKATINFSDPDAQLYLPAEATSSSTLSLPILSVAISGPLTVSPGGSIPYTIRVTNIGSAIATSATATVDLPDGGSVNIPITNLEPGTSFSSTVNHQLSVLNPPGAGESTAQYLARLADSDGALLEASVEVDWQDAQGNTYGEVGQRMFSSLQRLPILSLVPNLPDNVLPGEEITLSMTVDNIGGCTAVQGSIEVTNPDDTTTTADPFDLTPADSTLVETTYTVPLVENFEPEETGESEAEYLGRLLAMNDAAQDFNAELTWSDPGAVIYGPTNTPISTNKILPIVSITLSAPSMANSGDDITYAVSAVNIGSADASAIVIVVTLPDGTAQTLSVASLAPSAIFNGAVPFSIPSNQPNGDIVAGAAANWFDTRSNLYGPLTASAITTVVNAMPIPDDFLTLSPLSAGPNVTGTTQTMEATLLDVNGVGISGQTIEFEITGANIVSGTATTDGTGLAMFDYTGVINGTDTVTAKFGTVTSNSATIGWVTPVQEISTNTVFSRFFANPGNSGAFTITNDQEPLWTQNFPTINFNPPFGTIPGNTSSVTVFTSPFTNVTTDLNGNFTGIIAAQGNGFKARLSPIKQFQAVFTSAFTVAAAGDVVFNFFTDDGFILGVGNGATRVSGVLHNPPPSGLTEFEGLPVMGCFNAPTAPAARQVTVHFPAAGTYPYEVDYTECCFGQLSITMTTAGVSGNTGVPPAGSITLSPNTVSPLNTAEQVTFTATATDASGVPQAGAGIALIINGANTQQLSGPTDASGQVNFSYVGANAGFDSVQAVGSVASLASPSNIVSVEWNSAFGTADPSGTTPGRISSPTNLGLVTGLVPIILGPGPALVSGTVEVFPSGDPGNVTVLNPSASGGNGTTLATLDTTLLANGSYIVRLTGTDTQNHSVRSLILVTAAGDYKPGRFTASVTDVRVPLVGLPIEIQRTYDSLEKDMVGDFGHGWKLGIVGPRLEVDDVGNVTLTLGNRRTTFFFTPFSQPFPFSYLLKPVYTPEPGTFGSLTSDGCTILFINNGSVNCFPDISEYSPTTYTYTDPFGRKFTLTATGELLSIEDLNGNTLTVTPNGITSSSGNTTVAFVRDGQGRITQITDPESNSFDYSYDMAGDLVNVALPGIATPVTYVYDANHLLTDEIDPRGSSATATYDAQGRLQSITNAVSDTTSFSYDISGRVTTITNPDTGVEVVRRNEFGDVIQRTDPLQRVTTFAYDASRNRITEINHLGEITKFTYNDQGLRTSTTDPLTNTTTTVYNEFGGPTSIVDPLTRTQTIQYNESSLPISISDSLGAIAELTYDAQGSIIELRDAEGTPFTFTYDAQGNLTSRSDLLGHTATFDYDNLGRLTSRTDARNNATTFEYDALGRQTKIIDPLMGETRMEYDGNGNKTAEVDALGRRTEFLYDAADRLIRTTFPDLTIQQHTYDFRGNGLTTTDQLGRVLKREYDLAGQLDSETVAFGTADAGKRTFAYDAAGRLTQTTDERNNPTITDYDDAGRVIRFTDPLGFATEFDYDALGQLIRSTDPNLRETQFAYDGRGRLTQTTFDDATTTSTTYDGRGSVLTVTDQANRTTTNGYDAVGRLTSVTDAFPALTQFAYDANDNLTSQTDALSRVTSYEYDELNRRTKRTLPGGSLFETFSYDAVGNMTARTDFNGKTTTFDYDLLNRLTRKTPDLSFGAATVEFAYTDTGQRASMTDASGLTTYAYDDRDRLLQKSTPAGTLSYFYDAASNLISMQSSNTNGVWTTYTHDAANRVETVTDQQTTGTTSYAYDKTGVVERILHPNSVEQQFVYDPLYRVTSLPTRGAGLLEQFDYALDPTGRRTSVTQLSGRQASYTSDAIYRLTREEITGDPANNGAVDYSYDAVGNRTNLFSTLGPIASATYACDANDRLLADTYDNNGNTLASGGDTFAYDFEDRLIDFNNGQVVNVYDGDGNRVARSEAGGTTLYVIDDRNPTGFAQVVDEVSGGTVAATYTLGPQRASQTRWTGGVPATSYYAHDALGSVRLLTDSTGAVTDAYSQDAFGNPLAQTGTTPNPYSYVAEQFDTSMGLVNLRARWYAPAAGRFATADPFEGFPTDPATLHRYLYAAADPVNSTDPSGRLFKRALTANTVLAQAATFVLVFSAVAGQSFTETGTEVYCILRKVLSVLNNSDILTGGARDPLNSGVCSKPLPEQSLQNAIPPREQADKRLCEALPWPGWNPLQPPGPGWVWIGTGPPGSGRGNWHNPTTDESLFPDLNHDQPIGPHWDYIGPNGTKWRKFEDGRCEKKP